MSNPYGPDPYAEKSSNPYEAYVQSSPYGMPIAQTHPRSVPVLVMGILSIIAMPFLGPFAWVMGTKALREIDASPGMYSDRGNLVAGRILGIIGTVMLIIGVIIGVVSMVAFVALMSATTY